MCIRACIDSIYLLCFASTAPNQVDEMLDLLNTNFTLDDILTCEDKYKIQLPEEIFASTHIADLIKDNHNFLRVCDTNKIGA